MKQVQPRRRPGNSAGITRERIVEAARGIDLPSLTMQAVANELGVDRKAVTYHVSDRDELLTLLAADDFQRRFRVTVIPEGADWEEALLIYATSVADSLIASGSLAVSFRLTDEPDAGTVRPAEAVLEALIERGFSQEDAGRAIAMVTTLAMGFARDVCFNNAPGGHPQSPELHRVLDEAASEELPVLRLLDIAGFVPFDRGQLEFMLEITISGLAAQVSNTVADRPNR